MKKDKPDLRKLLLSCATVLVVCVLGFAIFHIVQIASERAHTKQVNDSLAQLVTAPVPLPEEASAPTETAAPQEPFPQEPLYHVPIEVDFELLQEQYPHVVAWIYCPDTPIHYPVVQGQNNYYYLDHLITGEESASGSIFLDSRVAADLSDGYNLIHGHNLQDSQLFGTLPQYRDQDYYNEHNLLYLLTPTEHYVIELFAGFTADHDDEIYRIPAAKKYRYALAQACVSRSDFVSDVTVQEEDKLIVLSTCSYAYDDARYAVIGILRKTQPRGGELGGQSQ